MKVPEAVRDSSVKLDERLIVAPLLSVPAIRGNLALHSAGPPSKRGQPTLLFSQTAALRRAGRSRKLRPQRILKVVDLGGLEPPRFTAWATLIALPIVTLSYGAEQKGSAASDSGDHDTEILSRCYGHLESELPHSGYCCPPPLESGHNDGHEWHTASSGGGHRAGASRVRRSGEPGAEVDDRSEDECEW